MAFADLNVALDRMRNEHMDELKKRLDQAKNVAEALLEHYPKKKEQNEDSKA